MLEALSTTDIISLIILILIALVVLRYSASGSQSSRAKDGRRSALVGGGQPEVEIWNPSGSLTDTNEALLLTEDADSRYVGPDQAALALAMLDDAQYYDEVTGHIPADLPMFLGQSALPHQLGSNDPAALGSLVLLDPTARFGEELSDDPPHPALPILRVLAIGLIVLALFYRLIFF